MNDRDAVSMIVMHSTEVLPAARLSPRGPVGAAFLVIGPSTFRDAARHIAAVPYGRNSTRSDPLAVLREKRGTCSSKHALLALLAQEQDLPIQLFIGIYEMDDLNTPGVGPVLRKHSLGKIPEAHCYLKWRDIRIDVTRVGLARAHPIEKFLVEHQITAEHVAGYKVEFHRDFMRNWMPTAKVPRDLSLEQLWSIREACIRGLECAPSLGRTL
jgi:hypothetical protein